MYSAWKPDGHITSSTLCWVLKLWWMISVSQPPVAKPGWFEATGFAAVDYSHDIWSETIVKAFTNLCLFSTFNSRDSHWLSDCLHIISELHLHVELGPLTIISPTDQAQGTINKCLQENGKRWTNPKSSILAGVRDGRHFFRSMH